jgi:hypothetical protein
MGMYWLDKDPFWRFWQLLSKKYEKDSRTQMMQKQKNRRILIPSTARCKILVRASLAGSGGPAGPRYVGPGLYSAVSPSPATRTHASPIRKISISRNQARVIRIKKNDVTGSNDAHCFFICGIVRVQHSYHSH